LLSARVVAAAVLELPEANLLLLAVVVVAPVGIAEDG